MEDGGLPVSGELEILDLNDIWSKAGCIVTSCASGPGSFVTLDSVGTEGENLQHSHLYTEA